MPNVTATIDRDQRKGLCELVRNQLGAIGDVWIALEENEDFASAEQLGIEFGECQTATRPASRMAMR